MRVFPWALCAFLAIGITSCDPDEPEPPNPEELITTLTLTLDPGGGGDVATFTFRDLDGDGGNAPVITVDTLQDSTSYTGSITLLNESESPAEDITAEVLAEAEEHQLFYLVQTVLEMTVAYADMDANGNPLGLGTAVTTNIPSAGQLTITLRHEPDKAAAGVASGDITNAGGETDIEVTFDVVIE